MKRAVVVTILVFLLLCSHGLYGDDSDRSIPSVPSLRSIETLITSQSNCSSAVDANTYLVLRGQMNNRSRDEMPLQGKVSKDLKLINAGSGTTGTGGLKSIICDELKLKAVHHMDRCERGPRLSGHVNPLVSWKSALLWYTSTYICTLLRYPLNNTKCRVIKSCLGYADDNFRDKVKHQRRCSRLHALKGNNCSTSRFLRKLDESLTETFLQRPLEAISDSPGTCISDLS